MFLSKLYFLYFLLQAPVPLYCWYVSPNRFPDWSTFEERTLYFVSLHRLPDFIPATYGTHFEHQVF